MGEATAAPAVRDLFAPDATVPKRFRLPGLTAAATAPRAAGDVFIASF
jgi:hypothetical protein